MRNGIEYDMIQKLRFFSSTVAAVIAMSACGGESEGEPSAGTDTDASSTAAATSGSTSTVTSSTSGVGSTGSEVTSGETTSDSTSVGTTSGSEESSSGSDDTGEPMPPTEYEGYGASTEGAHSCDVEPEVVHVTTLDDGGAGSLREALSAGCREVVFDVGGTIVLSNDLNIPHSFITIDGASAPDPGITIEQPGTIGTTIEASGSIGPVHDVIIHHLRMDGLAEAHENDGDIWGLDGEAAAVHHVILDHITARGATDGVFDVWEDVHDVTMSWNLITDTVTAMHLSTGDESVPRARFSVHHNVFVGNNERQIRLRHDSGDIDYRNNVVFGWAYFEGGGAGLHIAYDDDETNPSLNVVGNVFHYVDGLDGVEDDAVKFEQGVDVGSVFFADNVVPAGEADLVSTSEELPVPRDAVVTLYSAESLADQVVPFVGTQFPTAAESERLAAVASGL